MKKVWGCVYGCEKMCARGREDVFGGERKDVCMGVWGLSLVPRMNLCKERERCLPPSLMPCAEVPCSG